MEKLKQIFYCNRHLFASLLGTPRQSNTSAYNKLYLYEGENVQIFKQFSRGFGLIKGFFFFWCSGGVFIPRFTTR